MLPLVAILPAKQILLEENSKFSHTKFSSQDLGIDKAANADHLLEKFDIKNGRLSAAISKSSFSAPIFGSVGKA